MKIRNLLIGCSLLTGALASMAAEYPEKLYLVGTMNNWTLQANENLIEVPAVRNGLYSATIDFKASNYDTPIAFKIFNTLSGDWMNESDYYGTYDTPCAIYKDAPSTWRLAPGLGSGDLSIPNVKELSDATITIDLENNTASISSSSAPLAPQELSLVDGGEDGVKYPLERTDNSTIYTGSISLTPGAHRLTFIGDNGFALGGLDWIGSVYLWKDRPWYYYMTMDSHVPIVINNWAGGKLEVSVNISNGEVCLNAPEQPELPNSINLVMKGVNGEDTKFPMSISHQIGLLTYSYMLQDWQNEMQFEIEVPGIGILKTNSDPIKLWKNVSDNVSIDPDYDNPIVVSNWEGGEISITVPESFSYVVLNSSTQPLPDQHLYLIGSPQQWNIKDGSMELTEIDSYHFVGEFDMPAEPIFRFYTELGNWESGSIGSQYDDIPVYVELYPEEVLNEKLVGGKGSWYFIGFPGGKMYMDVNLNNRIAKFSTQPIGSVEKIESEDMKINVIDGAIEVIAPVGYETVIYNLTGNIVGKGLGSYRMALRPGIYIVNHKKVMVL